MLREKSVREEVLSEMSGAILDDVELQMVTGSAALSPILQVGCCVSPSCMGSHAMFAATMAVD